MLAALVAGLLTACGGGIDSDDLATASGQVPGVEVSGTPGRPPEIRFEPPLEVDETRSGVVVPGEGAPLYLDRLFMLQLTMVDGRTGKKAVSTYDPGQRPLAVTDSAENLFPVLRQALVGLHQGSRLVVVATGEDTFGSAGAPQYGIKAGDPVVLVADVIAVPPEDVLDGPEGAPAELPADAPQLRTTDAQPAKLVFRRRGAALPAPDRLQIHTLVEGTGPPVERRGLVTLDYVGQVWGESTPFAATHDKEPVTVPLGVDGVVPAWDRALVGVPRGSRVLVVAPPSLGFGATGNPPDIPGNATLAYLIDVLGVS